MEHDDPDGGDPAGIRSADLAALGERFRAGDEDAFTELYRATARGIHDRLLRMVHDRGVAEDLTQATFLKAYERRSTLAEPERVVGWLFAVARNQALDHLRRHRPTASLDEGSAVSATPADDGWSDPVAGTLRDESVALVWDAAAGLEGRHLEVLDLSLRQGLGTGDLAVAMDVSADHAAVLVHRAKAALGHAVRQLLVARRRGRCERLDELVPAGVTRLTSAQRQTVDHHMRRCDVCRDTGDELVAPAALFGAVPLLALPARLVGPPHLPAVQPGTTGASTGGSVTARSASPVRTAGVAPGAKVAAVVLALLVVAGGVVVLVGRARTSQPEVATAGGGGAAAGGGSVPPSNPAGASGLAPGTGGEGGGDLARPASSAPLVTGGRGQRGTLAIDGVVARTTGCEGDFYRSAPTAGGTDFLYGPIWLEGDRLVLEATSATYRGELHEDGVLHLETEEVDGVQSTVDATMAADGSLTGVWSKVFLGGCVLHLQIRSGEAPTVAALTS